MTAPRLRELPDRYALVAALTAVCRAAIGEALAARGRASVALSGGTTPAPVYRTLAGEPLNWAGVTLALVDERWVAPDHEASNERLVRDCFAGPLAAGARLAAMKTAAARPADAVPEVERNYAPLRPFDLVVLGMGADGHVASWFPRAEGLSEALDPKGSATVASVRAVGAPVAGAYVERMTLTRPAVGEARRAVLVITGADKRAAYLSAAEAGAEADMPVRALWRAGVAAPEAYWAP
jgi:6-phosphogluconolactonase